MPKYIIKPGQKVTHGTFADAADHRAKMAQVLPGQSMATWPAAPTSDYEEGDEIELTEEQAASMPWAVCTTDEFEETSSPNAFIKKGYTRDEAESMAAGIREGMKARAEARKTKRVPQLGGGMDPLVPGGEVNPRAAGKFPDDSAKKLQK